MARGIGGSLVRTQHGVVGLGGAGGGVAAPGAILAANLTGLWDDASATMTGATWTNQTGGTNFTQGTGANQPIAGTAINGRPTLQTDGSNDRMDAAAISVLLTSSAFCVWGVARPLGALIAGPAVGTATRVFITDGGTGGYMAAGVATDPRGVSFDSGYDITTTPGAMLTNTVYQWRLRLSGGTLYYRLRNTGGVVGEGSVTAGNLGAMTGLLRFGTDYLGANAQSMDVAAIVTANIAPSAQQLTDMDAWTFSKWGV